ncbi:hypothetical protein AB835_09460 [Candidatus Endobugula sertula]|uniref:Integrase n=1 Tax=Candidatus Endobugula sertula TaxID=62101 RepID=A0A1D2QNZ2_9GAMM|nr:hypothetical protein AB835_09460 [Candidatus Endobugula sertula]
MSPLEKVKNHTPVTLEDLNAIGEGIAHVTEYGFCVHDFSMLPCQKHRDCINCTEQVCIKRDQEKLGRLRLQLERTQDQLKRAEQGVDREFYGAGRWVEHQHKTVERIKELIGLLESTEVEDGAVIRLRNNQEYSALKREASALTSNRKALNQGPDKSEMRALLGVGIG